MLDTPLAVNVVPSNISIPPIPVSVSVPQLNNPVLALYSNFCVDPVQVVNALP